jgi:UDP-N-acetylmuramate--alanine ligase
LSLSINGRNCSSLHFVGILGSGMSALAQYLRWENLDISGSDRIADTGEAAGVRQKLEHTGCTIHAQDGSGVGPRTGALVVSTAIEESNPDIAAARKNNIPVFHRSDVLAAIAAAKQTIAIAGTSGKSTVAAMVFHLLERAGKQPSLIGGANCHSLIKSGYIGNAFHGSSDLLVIEADESDGSLVKYHPEYSVFLNLSKDHKPEDETLGLFRQLAAQSQTVIINADDARLEVLGPYTGFGEAEGAHYRAELSCDTQSAHVAMRGKNFGVPFPGRHMAQNLLASLCICSELGVDETAMAAASKTYQGLQRRFDRLITKKGVTVIDDYAHNPEKIRAACAAAQSLSPRVFALFQPHGFAPTRFLFNELVSTFADLLRPEDRLYLLPIYYAGGTVQKDIASADIARELKACRAKIIAPDRRDEAVADIAANAKDGDVVISMGARDPSLPAFAQSIAAAIDNASA